MSHGPILTTLALLTVVGAAYAYGIWKRQRWVVGLAIAFAGYVMVDLVLFARTLPREGYDWPFLLVYTVVTLSLSTGAALVASRFRDRLH